MINEGMDWSLIVEGFCMCCVWVSEFDIVLIGGLGFYFSFCVFVVLFVVVVFSGV